MVGRIIRKVGILLIAIGLAGCNEGQYIDSKGRFHDKEIEQNWQVFNYWATWCEPCYQEVPELNKLHEDAFDVKVFGINFDGLQSSELDVAIAKMKIDYPVLIGMPSSLNTRPPQALPMTIIISPGGQITELVGPQTSWDIQKTINRMQSNERVSRY